MKVNLFASNFNNQPWSALEVSMALPCWDFSLSEHQGTGHFRTYCRYRFYSELDIPSSNAMNSPCIYLTANYYHWMLGNHLLLSTKGRDGDGCFSCVPALCKRGRRQKISWILNSLSWLESHTNPARSGNRKAADVPSKHYIVRPSLFIMPKETGNQGSFKDPRPLIKSSVILAGPLTETKNFQN